MNCLSKYSRFKVTSFCQTIGLSVSTSPNSLNQVISESVNYFFLMLISLSVTRLTENSLHPAHSLDYYKRTQLPFVQLVSCNDPGLKQVPKCRACRQLKVGAHYDASLNGESGGAQFADDNSTVGVESVCPGRGSTTVASLPTASNRDGQFKRPTNGRNSQVDRTGNESERPRDRDKLRSKKVMGAGTASGSPIAVSNMSYSDPPGGSGGSVGGGGGNPPVSVFCRFWGFRK